MKTSFLSKRKNNNIHTDTNQATGGHSAHFQIFILLKEKKKKKKKKRKQLSCDRHTGEATG